MDINDGNAIGADYDNIEEQRNEIDTLRAIYAHDFTILNHSDLSSFQITVVVHDYDDCDCINEDEEECPTEAALQITYTPRYPDEAPQIRIVVQDDNEDARYADWIVMAQKEIEQLASSSLGSPMVYELIQKLNELMLPESFRKKKQKQRQQQQKKKPQSSNNSKRKNKPVNYVSYEEYERQQRQQRQQQQQQQQNAEDDETFWKNRPADKIFQRIKWDPVLSKYKSEFVIGYLDRFEGILEMSFEEFEVQDEIPFHRVRVFKFRGTIVWDRKQKLDLLTGMDLKKLGICEEEIAIGGDGTPRQEHEDTGSEGDAISDNEDEDGGYFGVDRDEDGSCGVSNNNNDDINHNNTFFVPLKPYEIKLNVQRFLLSHSLAQLTEKYAIKVTRHRTVPLVILNYDQLKSPRTNPIVQECRGLVLEDRSWRIVAKSMDRFFCWGERDVKDQMSSFDFSNFAAWSKEDGTFMLMYNYRGKWYVNCRHNFADDRLPSKPDWTYRDLFEHASGGLTLDELGQRAQLDPRFSYAFELCSPYNKVIRQYNQPTLFLLTAHQTVVDEDESIARSDSAPKELTDDELGALAERMARESVNGRTVQRPQKFTRFHNMEEIIDYLQTDCMKNDPTFEGFVLKDGHNHRWKIKSLSYRSIHKLRYRGWVKATPRNLIDFVLEGEGPELLAILSQYPAFTPTTASGISAANNNNNNNNTVDEIRVKYEAYELRVKMAYEQLKSLWEQSLPMVHDKNQFSRFVASTPLSIRVPTEHGNHSNNNNNNNNERVALERITLDLAPLKKILFELQKTKGRNQTEEDLDKLFRQSKQLILKTLFADMQNVVYSSIKHSPRYCDFDLDAVKNNPDYANSGLASRPPKYNAQLGEWDIWCFCGSPMRLCRLKTDRVQYKYCFCGEKMGVHVVKVGTLIYVCSNAPHCERTHSARQANIKFANDPIPHREGDPYGIPCSRLCKTFRLRAHDFFDTLWRPRCGHKKKGSPSSTAIMSKEEAYRWLARALDIPPEEAHIGRFSIDQCVRCIEKVQEEIMKNNNKHKEAKHVPT